MTATAEQIKTLLRELPTQDRAELAHFLLRSLDEGGPPRRANGASEQSLDDQLRQRLEETLAGLPVNEPIDEALSELRRLIP